MTKDILNSTILGIITKELKDEIALDRQIKIADEISEVLNREVNSSLRDKLIEIAYDYESSVSERMEQMKILLASR